MSGNHIVGDAKRDADTLRQWVANGLQLVVSVKPEPGDGAFLRDTLGPSGFLVGRFTDGNYWSPSAIESRYIANPLAEAQNAWNLYAPLAGAHPQFNCWQPNNEPHPNWDKLVAFMRHCIDIFNSNGQGVALFNFSRGTPEPGDWPRFYDVWRYALAKNATLPPGKQNILSIHQYGSFEKSGPGSLFHNEMWHLKRFEMLARPSLPADLKRAPYVITEAGPDMPGGFKVAYKDHEDAFVHDWRVYNEWLATQPGCKGAAYFTDGQEGGFASFDIRDNPMRAKLASQHYPPMTPAQSAPVPVPPPPPPPPPPDEPEPPMSEKTELLRGRLAAHFGDAFSDLRASLPKHKEHTYSRRPLSAIEGYAVHHTGTGTTRGTTWQRIAQFHVDNPPGGRGWPGIAYTLGFRLINDSVRVALLNDLETVSYHVGDANRKQLALVLMGDFSSIQVQPKEVYAMQDAVKILDEVLGKKPAINPHFRFRNTTCPANVNLIIPSLRVQPPPPPQLKYDKVAFFLEEAMRAAEREGFHAESDHIEASALYQEAKAKR